MTEEQIDEIESLKKIIREQKRSIKEHIELLKMQKAKLKAKFAGFEDLYRAYAEQDDVPDHLMELPEERIVN